MTNLDRTAQKRIVQFLEDRIARAGNPQDFGKPLKGDKVGLWRYRIGNYRVISRIEDDRLVVLILRIAHRKEAYR